jgi:hypothetical protein
MTDIRIKYLRFSEQKPLLFSGIAVSALCIVGAIGLITEHGETCHPDLRLWLSVVLARSGMRFLCKFYLANRERLDESHASAKCVEILDVFGIVWFAIGNLLVFNNFDCIPVSPVVFFSSLSYICFSYFSFFLPPLLRSTLRTCQPTHPDDIEYMRRQANATRELNIAVGAANRLQGLVDPLTGTLSPNHPNNIYSPDLTPERARYWAEWLQSYGCYELSYDPAMDLKTAAVVAAARTQQSQQSQQPQQLQQRVTSKNDDHNKRYESLAITDEEAIELGLVSDQDKELGTVVAAEEQRLAQQPQPSSAAPFTLLGGQEDSDFCSVCLLPFETVEVAAAAAAAAAASSSAQAPVNASGEAAPESDASNSNNNISNSSSTNNNSNNNTAEGRVPLNNNLIVRYPCPGHHYFHAHCLHSWLQVASARHLNSAQGRRSAATTAVMGGDPHRIQVTCPCCREHPMELEGTVAAAAVSSGSGRGAGGGGGGGSSGGSQDPVPVASAPAMERGGTGSGGASFV